MFEYLKTPCSDSGDGSRTSYTIPEIPAYEALKQEMAESGSELELKLAKLVEDDMVPPVYTTHPVAIASNMKAPPIVLYVDGVPTTKKDGVVGFWVDFLLSVKRHLVCVAPKKNCASVVAEGGARCLS